MAPILSHLSKSKKKTTLLTGTEIELFSTLHHVTFLRETKKEVYRQLPDNKRTVGAI